MNWTVRKRNNMLSQESQKMYLECNVAIKCQSNFSIRCIARMLRLIEKWYGMKKSGNRELKKTHGRATNLLCIIPSIDACFLQLQFCTHCTPPFLSRVVDVQVVFSAILAPLFPLRGCKRTAKIAKIRKLMKIYVWWRKARTSEANVFPFAVFHSFSRHLDRPPNFIFVGPLLDNNIWIKSNQTNNLNDVTKKRTRHGPHSEGNNLISPRARTMCNALNQTTYRASIFPLKFLNPANAVSLFENCHFLSHRPPIISPCSSTNYAQTSPTRISPSRNSLCRENRIRGARAARTAGYAE